MISDAQVSFLPIGSPAQSMVAGAGVNVQIGNILDILGAGVGVAPPNIIGVQNAIFGEDPGIGATLKPEVEVVVGTAFATGNAATWNIALQAAPDLGAGGNYQPGAWTTLIETGAQAVANAGAGAVLARFDFPPAIPPGLRPRFFRLLLQVPAATNLNAGTVIAAPVVLVRDDQANKFGQKNFAVA